MKKLGLLIVGAFLFLLTNCDATPGGNKSIMPVEHEEAVEHIDHHDGHEAHTEEDHTDHHASEKKDSADDATAMPKKDTAKVDASPENAAH